MRPEPQPPTNEAPAGPAADCNSRQPLRRGARALPPRAAVPPPATRRHVSCGGAGGPLDARWGRPSARAAGREMAPRGSALPPLPRLLSRLVVRAGRIFSHEALSPRVLITILLYFSYGRYGKIQP